MDQRPRFSVPSKGNRPAPRAHMEAPPLIRREGGQALGPSGPLARIYSHEMKTAVSFVCRAGRASKRMWYQCRTATAIHIREVFLAREMQSVQCERVPNSGMQIGTHPREGKRKSLNPFQRRRVQHLARDKIGDRLGGGGERQERRERRESGSGKLPARQREIAQALGGRPQHI